MVSDYSEAGQEGWLSDTRIDLLRGTGRIAGHGVIDVNGRRYTAEHILIAMGSSPVTPPVPGLRELEGVWSTRGGDQHESRPAAPLVLGGGPADVELAKTVRRLGGEKALAEAADRVLAREPARLGEDLGEALARDGIELPLGALASGAHREGEDFVVELDDGGERC